MKYFLVLLLLVNVWVGIWWYAFTEQRHRQEREAGGRSQNYISPLQRDVMASVGARTADGRRRGSSPPHPRLHGGSVAPSAPENDREPLLQMPPAAASAAQPHSFARRPGSNSGAGSSSSNTVPAHLGASSAAKSLRIPATPGEDVRFVRAIDSSSSSSGSSRMEPSDHDDADDGSTPSFRRITTGAVNSTVAGSGGGGSHSRRSSIISTAAADEGIIASDSSSSSRRSSTGSNGSSSPVVDDKVVPSSGSSSSSPAPTGEAGSMPPDSSAAADDIELAPNNRCVDVLLRCQTAGSTAGEEACTRIPASGTNSAAYACITMIC
jgi:hypothetical protein